MPKRKIRVRVRPHLKKVRTKRGIRTRVIQRYTRRVLKNFGSEGIRLINPRKFELGSVEWQDAMRNNIREKLRRPGEEELSSAEKNFLAIQHRHNVRGRLYKNLGAQPRVKQTKLDEPLRFEEKPTRVEVEQAVQDIEARGDLDPLTEQAVFALKFPGVVTRELRRETPEQMLKQVREREMRQKPEPSGIPTIASEKGKRIALTQAQRKIAEAEIKIIGIARAPLIQTDPKKAKFLIDVEQKRIARAREIIREKT